MINKKLLSGALKLFAFGFAMTASSVIGANELVDHYVYKQAELLQKNCDKLQAKYNEVVNQNKVLKEKGIAYQEEIEIYKDSIDHINDDVYFLMNKRLPAIKYRFYSEHFNKHRLSSPIPSLPKYKPIYIGDSLNYIRFYFDQPKGQIIVTAWKVTDSLSLISFSREDHNDTIVTKIGFRGENPHVVYKNNVLINKKKLQEIK